MAGGASPDSGAEGLAATAAAQAQHLAPPRGRLAGEEAVAARANEIAGLESALHVMRPGTRKRPPFGRPDVAARLVGHRRQVKIGQARAPSIGPEQPLADVSALDKPFAAVITLFRK